MEALAKPHVAAQTAVLDGCLPPKGLRRMSRTLRFAVAGTDRCGYALSAAKQSLRDMRSQRGSRGVLQEPLGPGRSRSQSNVFA